LPLPHGYLGGLTTRITPHGVQSAESYNADFQ
jgi:hypothetical protein